MSLDDLKAMGHDIQLISSPDAHLWLWTTNPQLPEALEIMTAWGFTYKTMLTWVKPRMGLGWWLRSKTEHILLGVKSNKLRVQPNSYTTVFHAPWTGHSVKPEKAYEIIEALSPTPRLELFARSTRTGWTSIISDAPPVGDPYGQG